MGVYVQEDLSQVKLTFGGPWAVNYTVDVDVVHDASLITITLPSVVHAGSTTSAITCQLPGNLNPLRQVNYIGCVESNSVIGSGRINITDSGLMTIFSTNASGTFAGTNQNGFLSQNISWQKNSV